MALIEGDTPVHTFHVSTGTGGTPTVRGNFRFYRKDPGYNEKRMYFSAYFIRGYATHGYSSVPNYNASHGCVRNPEQFSRFIYNWIDIGMPISSTAEPRRAADARRARAPTAAPAGSCHVIAVPASRGGPSAGPIRSRTTAGVDRWPCPCDLDGSDAASSDLPPLAPCFSERQFPRRPPPVILTQPSPIATRS